MTDGSLDGPWHGRFLALELPRCRGPRPLLTARPGPAAGRGRRPLEGAEARPPPCPPLPGAAAPPGGLCCDGEQVPALCWIQTRPHSRDQLQFLSYTVDSAHELSCHCPILPTAVRSLLWQLACLWTCGCFHASGGCVCILGLESDFKNKNCSQIFRAKKVTNSIFPLNVVEVPLM